MIVTCMQSVRARMNLRLNKGQWLVITVGDAGFCLRINDIRSVTALTPIFG